MIKSLISIGILFSVCFTATAESACPATNVSSNGCEGVKFLARALASALSISMETVVIFMCAPMEADIVSIVVRYVTHQHTVIVAHLPGAGAGVVSILAVLAVD